MAKCKSINLALQGGGAHGAFAWGVLDKFIEDDRLEIESICATSAGSMNAVVYAYGLMMGGNHGAREALKELWWRISKSGRIFSPVRQSYWGRMFDMKLDSSPSYRFFESFIRTFSPYEFNPTNQNPLKDILAGCVDFDTLKTCKNTKLFISATNVETGKVRVFKTNEVTLDVVMASACLPFLFQAVEIDGEHFWDGGYMGNPALFPLFYHADSHDIVIVHLNPIERPGVPTTAADINNRINEISFNSSLLKELRAVAFVKRLISEDMLKPQYKKQFQDMLVHSIKADEDTCNLSVASKFHTDWDFLIRLKEHGRSKAGEWLDKNYDKINHEATVDLRKEFLHLGSEHIG